MRRVNAVLMISVCLLTDGYPGLSSPCFAGLYTLVPRVLKSPVTRTPAVSEPRTTATTTTTLARFAEGAAVGTYGSACRRRNCLCSHANGLAPETQKRLMDMRQSLHAKPSTFDLRSQASTPSNHLCCIFLLPAPPQFLYQAPLGAQQLTRPDFSNLPHFGHVIVLAIVGVMDVVLIAVLIMSSRSSEKIGRRDTGRRVAAVGTDVHTVSGIDPCEPVNI